MNPTATDVVEEASACAALITLRTANTRDDPVEAGHSASSHDTAVTSEPTLEPASSLGRNLTSTATSPSTQELK